MKRLYDEADFGESREIEWIDALQAIFWRARAEGQQLDSRTLAEALKTQLGVSHQSAEAWVAGVSTLTEYVVACVDTGDALTEEEDAVHISRRAVRPLLEARLQRRIDHFEGGNRGAVSSSGHQLQSEGRRSRTRATLLRSVTTKRRWYVDPDAGGFSPAEQALGLPAGTQQHGLPR